MRESMPDGGEQDKRSDDGNFQISDASEIDQTSASTPASESSSVPSFQAAMDGHRRTIQDSNLSPLEWKKMGNVYFGKEDWEQALHVYRRGLTALREQRPALEEKYHGVNVSEAQSLPIRQTAVAESISGLSPAGASAADPLEVALRSNTAFVLLKLQQYDQAEEECNQLLKIDPTNSKCTILSVHNTCLLPEF